MVHEQPGIQRRPQCGRGSRDDPKNTGIQGRLPGIDLLPGPISSGIAQGIYVPKSSPAPRPENASQSPGLPGISRAVPRVWSTVLRPGGRSNVSQASAFAFRSFPLLLRLPLAFAPSGNKRHHHHVGLGWLRASLTSAEPRE